MKVEIAKSNETAAKANQRTEEIRSDNLKLGLQLEKKKQARLDIERRLAPRFLSHDEQPVITELIRPYAGHRVAISGNGDPEGRTLC
jgi:hypothetical protein